MNTKHTEINHAIDVVEESANKLWEVGPAGGIVYITEIAIAVALIIFTIAILIHLYFYFKKRSKHMEKIDNGSFFKSKNGVHFLDRIRNLERSDEKLFSKIDRITENLAIMNEKITRIDTKLEILLKK